MGLWGSLGALGRRTPVTLSGAKRGRKVCGGLSEIHAICRTHQVGRLDFARISAQVNPGRICSFDQGDLLSTSPTLELLLACDGLGDVLKSLEPDEPIAVVLFGEALMLFPFVLEDSFVQVSGHADVECFSATGDDVREGGTLVHI